MSGLFRFPKLRRSHTKAQRHKGLTRQTTEPCSSPLLFSSLRDFVSSCENTAFVAKFQGTSTIFPMSVPCF